MKSITIIGSGFSSAISKIVFNKFNPKIFSCNDPKYLKNKFVRRKNIETNKFFCQKAYSYGSTKFKVNKLSLHDRLSFGGNTQIWGGMINIKNISNQFVKILNENEIFLEDLNLDINGYSSNNNYIKKIVDDRGFIFNFQNVFTKIENKFLLSFELINNQIKLNFISPEKNNLETRTTDILILALSFPQLIDLLIRSKFITKDVSLELNEFYHRFKLSFKKKLNNKNGYNIVKYSLIRSISHFLGIDIHKIIKLKKIPLFVDQIFYSKKRTAIFHTNLNKSEIVKTSKNQFGDSSHYCDLKIDKISINEYLKSISKNILGVSMPFVSQKEPGPISNDIIENILRIKMNNIN